MDRHDEVAAMDNSVSALLRHFGSLSAGAHLAESAESLCVATALEYTGPMHNAALRTDPTARPSDVLAAAEGFFAPRDRRFILWIAVHRDHDLATTAAACGFGVRGDSRGAAGMIRSGPIEPPSTCDTEIVRVETSTQAKIFTELVTIAFAARQHPQPQAATRSLFTPVDTVLHPRVVAFLAVGDGTPCGAAMSYLEDSIATLSWVSTLPRYRRRGIAQALTTACVNESLRRRARLVALQSSSAAEGMYARMGFREVTRYQRMISPAPGSIDGRSR